MTKTQFHSPHFRKLGYLIWLVLLFFSIYFYQERVLFLDAGFLVFKLINEGFPQIFHFRFSNVFVEILPWIGIQLGLPLKWIMILYSASYLLFFGMIYHLLVSWLKNDFLGWVLIFLFTLLSLDTFYHIQSEFYLGLALLLLVFGIVLKYKDLKQGWIFPVLGLLIITIVFSHKMTLIPFVFLWLFFLGKYIEERSFIIFIKDSIRFNKSANLNPGLKYLLLLFLFLLITIFKTIFFTNWYEAWKSSIFESNLIKFFPNFLDIPANFIFLERMVEHYYWFPILLLVVSVFYLFKKEWFKLLLVWAFCIGQLLLYALADPEAPHRFYSEVNYLPLSIFVLVPILFEILPLNVLSSSISKIWGHIPPSMLAQKLRQGQVIGLSIIFLIIASRLFLIAQNHQTFENRIVWMEENLEKVSQHNTNRSLILQEDVPMELLIQDWGIPYNALLLTAIESPDSAKTIFIHENFDNYKRKDLLEKDNYFLTRFHNQAIRADSLNTDYFRLKKAKYEFVVE